MTENTENLVLEVLRGIRADVTDLKEGQGRVERRLSSLEHHLATLVSADAFDREDFDNLRRRLERIERRLELTD